ncbi:hypothetical protein IT568_05810 [bacterium]|nr:hypothetical protein [bacterium]
MLINQLLTLKLQNFGGKVFMIFSENGEVANKEILQEIQKEILKIKESFKKI